MTKKDEKELYWNLRDQTMGGRKFGESVTEFFTEKERRDIYLDKGAISYIKPETYEAAEQGELVGLRKAVKSKDVEISGLKNQLKQTPKSVKEAKEKILKLEADIVELGKGGGGVSSDELDAANAKITKLEAAAKGKPAEKVTQLEEKLLDREIDVEHLTEMVNVMEPDWKPSKDGK